MSVLRHPRYLCLKYFPFFLSLKISTINHKVATFDIFQTSLGTRRSWKLITLFPLCNVSNTGTRDFVSFLAASQSSYIRQVMNIFCHAGLCQCLAQNSSSRVVCSRVWHFRNLPPWSMIQFWKGLISFKESCPLSVNEWFYFSVQETWILPRNCFLTYFAMRKFLD